MHKSKDCDWSMLYWLCSHWSDFTETRLTVKGEGGSILIGSGACQLPLICARKCREYQILLYLLYFQ